jgi:hypothetical protein
MNDNFKDIYLTFKEAAKVLTEHNIHTNISQLHRAASPDIFGVKRLPFFQEPATGYYLISKHALLEHYAELQRDAKIKFNIG